jgi:hypothetical protein
MDDGCYRFDIAPRRDDQQASPAFYSEYFATCQINTTLVIGGFAPTIHPSRTDIWRVISLFTYLLIVR